MLASKRGGEKAVRNIYLAKEGGAKSAVGCVRKEKNT